MKLALSPLFEPVLWKGSGFKILNELSLPEKVEYIEISDVAPALEAVQQMKTRAFGQVLTFVYSGALMAQQYQGQEPGPLREQLERMTRAFCDARPTFDFTGLGGDISRWFLQIPAGASAGKWIADKALEWGRQIITARQARAKRAASLLPSSARVLTHCNVSGELVAIAQYGKALGKDIAVIATETRPYLQGTRLTAWELAQAGIAVSLIPDCAIAQVMAHGEVNAVIVGADRSAQSGDVINKVGTYPLALMAREYGVPFYALVQDPRSLTKGSDVPIEERPASELLTFQGRSLVAVGNNEIAVRYPAFDVTPAELITCLVGFDDLYTPETFRGRYQYQSTAREVESGDSGKYVLVYGIPTSEQIRYLSNVLKMDQAESILVPEMRPQLWGAHRVTPELLRRKVPTTFISDNIMGTLFAQGEIRKLCLFYSSLTEEGPIGICGSLLAVRLAHLHGVPIELLAGEDHHGSMADRDVTTFLGIKVCPAGVSVRAVENEIMPWALCKE